MAQDGVVWGVSEVIPRNFEIDKKRSSGQVAVPASEASSTSSALGSSDTRQTGFSAGVSAGVIYSTTTS